MTAAATRPEDRCRHGPAARRAPGALAALRRAPAAGAAGADRACTASACRPGSSAARGSTGCSPAPARRRRTRTFASARTRASRRTSLIRRDGGARAVRAVSASAPGTPGASQYRGRSGCNDFSIGIELEGTDDTPYTRGAVRGARGADRGAARRLPVALGRAPRRPQRHRAGAQDRSGACFDWPRLRAALAGRLGGA